MKYLPTAMAAVKALVDYKRTNQTVLKQLLPIPTSPRALRKEKIMVMVRRSSPKETMKYTESLLRQTLGVSFENDLIELETLQRRSYLPWLPMVRTRVSPIR